MILPKDRDPRFITLRRGGTLTEVNHQLLAVWATLDRLHTKGMIGAPKNKNTSVGLMDEGVAEAVAAFQQLFGVAGDAG